MEAFILLIRTASGDKMDNGRNKHGLSRYIPADIRRAVRKRDGYGCIFCATPIIEYEHVDPTFAEAQEHSEHAITLLCPLCHRKVTNRQISKDMVKQQMLKPAAKNAGAVGDVLYFSDSHPEVIFGGMRFIHCEIPIQIGGENIFWFEQDDGKYLLNARFWDSKGNESLNIDCNQWVIKTDVFWDFSIIANRIYIHESEKEPAMVIKIENNNTIIIEHFKMLINRNNYVQGDDKTLKVNGISLSGGTMSHCKYGMQFG